MIPVSRRRTTSPPQDAATTADSSESRPLPSMKSLFQEHGAFVFRTARRLGIAEGDLDDIVQEVFLLVHRKRPQYDGLSPVRAWLFGMVRHAARDYRKKAHRKREVAVSHEVGNSRDTDQEAIVRLREKRRVLDAALDQLDDEKREVFVLYQLEGMSMKEVALVLGCPLQTGYSRLAAAREKVKRHVERYYADRRRTG